MKSKSKLGKLKMPMDHGMDLSDLHDDESSEHDASEGSPEEEASESPEEEQAEQDAGEGDEAGSEHQAYLDKCSDDDLMAEVRKRGLMAELQKGEQAPEHDMEDSGKEKDHGMY